jgi:hypothetical protein
MLSSNGRNPLVLLALYFSTCLKFCGALICPIRALRGPLYALSFLLTEKLPRLDAREAKFLVLSTHSLAPVDGLSRGSAIGEGIRRG